MMENDLVLKLEKFQILVSSYLKDNRATSEIYDLYKNNKCIFSINTIKETIEKWNSDRDNLVLRTISFEFLKEFHSLWCQINNRKIHSLKNEVTIQLGGDKVNLNYALQMLKDSDNRYDKRIILNQVEDVCHKVINPELIKEIKYMDRLCQELGFNDGTSACAKLRGIDTGSLVIEFNHFISDSQHIYETLLEYFSNKILNIDIKSLCRTDLPSLWRPKLFESSFNHIKPKEILYKYLKAINMESLISKIEIKESDYYKGNGSYCLPVNPPNKILVNLAHRNRIDDFRVSFHEFGHAIHFSSVAQKQLVWERRWIDPVICETVACLFENLFYEQNFVEMFIGKLDNEYYDYCKFVTVHQPPLDRKSVIQCT